MIHVKSHRRGKSVVKAYTRSSIVRSRKAAKLESKIFSAAMKSNNPERLQARYDFVRSIGFKAKSLELKKRANLQSLMKKPRYRLG